MEIVLENVSRNFNRQKVFQNVSYTFQQGGTYAVLGGNGSGKSTLLKVVSSALSSSSGKIHYTFNTESVSKDKIPYNISIAAPYFELIEELTAKEFLDFHQKFKSFENGISSQEVLEITYLTDSADKEIRNFSSGMKQRLKLGVALLSDSSVVLLDEPISNLDPEGIEWYKTLIKNHKDGKTILVGSNFNTDEMGFCQAQIEIKDFK